MLAGKQALAGRLMLVFALSGFSGLIYQSIWTQYLGLTLGHAAYAQVLVLAIYMGGLALGSWLASRMGARIANAILAYALVELAIGVFAFVFHPIFLGYTQVSQATVLPQLAPAAVHAYQWSSAALLILPQCVLLGSTFPLMAAGCLRLPGSSAGRLLGGLYFTNSFGAAIGALVATFVLLPEIGMPGAMLVAGGVNVLVAALAWQRSRGSAPVPAERIAAAHASTDESAAAARGDRLLPAILLAAAITGGTSFVYEISWVRMLNLAFGTTLHSFELMLAAFILGLAAGAFWIHRRGDASANTLRLAGLAQVGMGLMALLSAVAFGQSFRWVAWLVATLPPTEGGYALYNLGCAAIALLVMFPAAFFAGSTLPLFTMSLLRRGHDERAIGRVYAVNTLGAIAGVFVAVHALIPGMGVHLSLLSAAVADVVLGVVLLWYFGDTRRREAKNSVYLAAVVAACALLFGHPDPLVQVSGVFRTGQLLDPAEARVIYLRDGKTATVSVIDYQRLGFVTIGTNGKADAGMTPTVEVAPVGDEVTMLMLGALPLALHPAPDEVGGIGWGSGLTTHTLLGSSRPHHVETVEIEPAMYEGARRYGARVARAYTDPRSHVVFDDARTWFSAGRKQYDVIFSEPSNPWVSGVASLFTEEFYAFLRGHLKPHGVLVQWLQSYEINDRLQARIVAALLKRFAHVDAYLTNANDLVLVASQEPLPPLDFQRLQQSPLREELARVGLVDAQAFTARRIGGERVLRTYARVEGANGHSDFHPVVALEAPRSRFLSEDARLLGATVLSGVPMLDLLDGRRVVPRKELYAYEDASSFVMTGLLAGQVSDILDAHDQKQALQRVRGGEEKSMLERVLASASAPIGDAQAPAWSADVAGLATCIASLPAADLDAAWIHPRWLAPGQGPAVRALMAAYAASAARDAAGMQARGSAVLAMPVAWPLPVRKQMLLIAMTGAAARGDYAGARALQARYGGALPHDDVDAALRRFVLEWESR
jgi:spermidine synthase